MFSPEKIAQAAAFFVVREGGKMHTMKLVKLLYLADRESFDRHGFPITYDDFLSMKHGPVLSGTLDLINGQFDSDEAEQQWTAWISPCENHHVRLQREIEDNDLDCLSRAGRQVLDSVWKKFGGYNESDLSEWTHEHCAEWQDPGNGRKPIECIDILRALKKSEAVAHACADDIREEKAIDTLFAELRATC